MQRPWDYRQSPAGTDVRRAPVADRQTGRTTGQARQCTKSRCGQMTDCADARFHLDVCDVRSLDRDGDGIPCESICLR